MARALAVVVLIVGAVLGGCILVTGGTDGYTAPDAGSRVTCTSPNDCEAGLACCYGYDDAGVSTTCQASCPFVAQTACSVASDCGDGGVCLQQTCPIDAGSAGTFTLTVKTCGTIPMCSQ
jgi:hypothetical protein